LLVYVVLLSGVVTLDATTRPKFQPSGSGEAATGRYLVTLADEAVTDDLGTLERELAVLYGGRIETSGSTGVQQFAITMLPSRARLLSGDPRVSEVVEMPRTTDSASPPRFTQHPSGFGDNGQSGTYTYDGAGNISAIGADTYVYDTAQRLVHSVTRGVPEDYTYDAFGNRKSATGAINCLGQTTCAQSVTVDSNTNHLTTINGAAVTYDDAGSIKSIATTSTSPGAVYTYDGTGMMTEATVSSDDRQFLYTADDERIAVKQGASWTWTLRDLGGKVLREFTSLETGPNLAMTNWQWAKDYVWRDGLLLATVTPAGTLHYHLDHLETPRLVTDAKGVKVAEHAYYPFGAEVNVAPHETPEEAMKFTGHERDIVAGDGRALDDMHARYFHASLGRFLSVDPELNVNASLHNPQKWNRYAYVINNPLLYHDPTGKQEAAGFAMDRDVRDLLAHRITEKEYWARLNARGVGAAIGVTPWAGWWGVRTVVSLFSVGAVAESAGGGSVLLGETMRRVQPVADEMNASTFNEAWSGDKAQMMARNMTWLQGKIESGARIFDIGKDALRRIPSDFYAAETKMLQGSGYTRQFVRYVVINGEMRQLFEWTKAQ